MVRYFSLLILAASAALLSSSCTSSFAASAPEPAAYSAGAEVDEVHEIGDAVSVSR
jgi:hypothetical protein